MNNLAADLQTDLKAINQISVIPTILEVICRTTGMGFAVIARVTEDRWVACSVRDEIQFGLQAGGELTLETTICNEIRQHHKNVVIDHVSEDKVFSSHHTPAMYGFESYISIPIFRRDKSFFGTLCAIDPRPAKLNNPETIGMFQLYADLISFHLDAVMQVNTAEIQLLEEQQSAALRERFIAILGHDLRNPLGAITNSAQLMLRMPLDDRQKRIAGIIKDSAYRMNGLIENVLDFARGRLGGGIIIDYSNKEPMEDILKEVIAELQTRWPTRCINLHTQLQEDVRCDGKRIAQLFSNLLGNALTHGEKDSPIEVEAICADGTFTLQVSNAGEIKSPTALKTLFQPFSTGTGEPGKQGLGLGLYIASEIAKAHAGQLDVQTGNGRTSFTLKLRTEEPPGML